MKRFAGVALLFALLITSTISRADIIFTLGNNPQANEENVLLNSGLTGTLLTGTLNQSGFTVNFQSSQTLLEPSSGQARVSGSPEGTPLTNLTISLAGATYGDIIFNPFFGSGTATITVNALNALLQPETFTFSYTLGNGNNFLTIVAKNGERIVNTTISTPGGILDVRQTRISEAAGLVVPEPASMLLLGTGLLAIGGLVRRRIG